MGRRAWCGSLCRRFWVSSRLRPWLWGVALAAYVLAGGAALCLLEEPLRERRLRQRDQDRALKRWTFTENATEAIINNTQLLLFLEPERSAIFLQTFHSILRDYEAHMGVATASRFERQWDVWNSSVYALGLITTIGNGGRSPASLGGQIFVFAFTLLGVPLLLSTVGEWAKLIYNGMELINARCQLPEEFESHGRSLSERDTLLATRPARPRIKLTVVISMVVIWLLGCAATLFYWEDVGLGSTYWESIFVLFMSFCTVEVPSLGEERGLLRRLAALGCATVALVLVSLSVRVLGLLQVEEAVDDDCSIHEPPGIFPALPKDQSGTFSSGITGHCAKVRDKMVRLSPMNEVQVVISNPKAAEAESRSLEVDARGRSRIADVSPSALSHGIRDDERVWFAEVNKYSDEVTLTKDLQADVDARPYEAK